ncbi:DUF6578 domain-containing protein [Streptomyces canus]|uniref:DUF6578 domain-containing protein n=1 Tax=Streptomyces canus TaxID=58343 RepID=UPI000749D59D|nr:DUF6578 domain-containing protein [Streptomyces canus]KUN14668.1 hypothetical protein AQI96_04300 [Streptomyces canus]
MGLSHVFYADWQMECCGTPFSVGEEVRWPLLFHAADDILGGGWRDQLTELEGPVEQGGERVLRDRNGLVVGVGVGESAAAPGDSDRLVGLLTVETHGGRLPEVRGRGRCVQVVTQEYRETEPGSRTWEPLPGRRSLRSVDASPKWFAGGGGARSEAGLMVTLEVPHTDSGLSHTVRRTRDIPPGPSPGTETQGLPAGELAELLAGLSKA